MIIRTTAWYLWRNIRITGRRWYGLAAYCELGAALRRVRRSISESVGIKGFGCSRLKLWLTENEGLMAEPLHILRGSKGCVCSMMVRSIKNEVQFPEAFGWHKGAVSVRYGVGPGNGRKLTKTPPQDSLHKCFMQRRISPHHVLCYVCPRAVS